MGENMIESGQEIIDFIKEIWENNKENIKDGVKKGVKVLSEANTCDLVAKGYDYIAKTEGGKYSDEVVKNIGVNYTANFIKKGVSFEI